MWDRVARWIWPRVAAVAAWAWAWLPRYLWLLNLLRRRGHEIEQHEEDNEQQQQHQQEQEQSSEEERRRGHEIEEQEQDNEQQQQNQREQEQSLEEERRRGHEIEEHEEDNEQQQQHQREQEQSSEEEGILNRPNEFRGKTTSTVVVCWILAILGGFLLGYNIGIIGVIVESDSFLWTFFPSIKEDIYGAKLNTFCLYNNPLLQLFTSSAYLCAIPMSFLSVWLSSKWGSSRLFGVATFLFIVGVCLTAMALNLIMLISGRLVLGIAFGSYSQIIPQYMAEIPHSRVEEAMTVGFAIANSGGTLVGQLVGFYHVDSNIYIWRVVCIVLLPPLIVLLVCSFLIGELPSNLVMQGRLVEAKFLLKRIRGIEEVDEEFSKIVLDSEARKNMKSPYKTIFKNYRHPAQISSIVIPLIQVVSGSAALKVFGPLLFLSIGFETEYAWVSSVVMSSTEIVGIILFMILIKSFGRRRPLISACLIMCITELLVAWIIHSMSSHKFIGKREVAGVVTLSSIYSLCYTLVTGPLGWMDETFPPETKVEGMLLSTTFDMIVNFVVAHLSFVMICSLRYLVYIISGVFLFVSVVIIYWKIPE